jgi:hypothetical protein
MNSGQTRRYAIEMALLGTAIAALPLSPSTPADADTKETDMNDPIHAFDLFAGQWKARHRVLKERLAGCQDWWDYEGTQEFRVLMGGWANIDENVLRKPTGTYNAITLRSYDPKDKVWRIWWLDERMPDTLGVPVVGSFVDGVGTFLADDTFNDKPVKVRFIWSKITRDSRQWEQAFSPDGGKTWETNWYSWFTRVG